MEEFLTVQIVLMVFARRLLRIVLNIRDQIFTVFTISTEKPSMKSLQTAFKGVFPPFWPQLARITVTTDGNIAFDVRVLLRSCKVKVHGANRQPMAVSSLTSFESNVVSLAIFEIFDIKDIFHKSNDDDSVAFDIAPGWPRRDNKKVCVRFWSSALTFSAHCRNLLKVLYAAVYTTIIFLSWIYRHGRLLLMSSCCGKLDKQLRLHRDSARRRSLRRSKSSIFAPFYSSCATSYEWISRTFPALLRIIGQILFRQEVLHYNTHGWISKLGLQNLASRK